MLPVQTRKEVMELNYQNYIQDIPVTEFTGAPYHANNLTVEKFKDLWVNNTRMNKERYGSFWERGIGQWHNIFKHKPCIVAGSGPSLAYNGKLLREKGEIPLISALHNYHFMVDNKIDVDFYFSIDAQEVTIEEVSEGGQNDAEFYWETTKGKKLVCFTGTSPELLKKWRGEIYFYSSIDYQQDYVKELDAIEYFPQVVNPGGSVLGAMVYAAKAYFGCPTIAYVGADFAFGYDKRFHAWDSKYDKNMGNVVRTVDIFGNKALTWMSYFGFKRYFEDLACLTPGIYINCTEGGIFGAHPEGNIMKLIQMPLSQFLNMCNASEDPAIIKIVSDEKAERITLY